MYAPAQDRETEMSTATSAIDCGRVYSWMGNFTFYLSTVYLTYVLPEKFYGADRKSRPVYISLLWVFET